MEIELFQGYWQHEINAVSPLLKKWPSSSHLRQTHRINLTPVVHRQDQGGEYQLQAARNSHRTGDITCQKVRVNSKLEDLEAH